MADRFKARYQAQDGYAGGAKPKFVTIDEQDILNCDTEDEMREIYDEAIYAHFQENVTPCGENEDEFLAWARERIAAKGK